MNDSVTDWKTVLLTNPVKSGDEVLGQGIATLFRKPTD